MTKLDAVIEKLRALPAEEQDYWAGEIEAGLAEPEDAPFRLTPSQEAELRRRLSLPDDLASDEEVEAFFARLDR